MAIISFRVQKEEKKLNKEYAASNNLSLSAFVRQAALEKIEAGLEYSEARMLKALNIAKQEESYDRLKVWPKPDLN